MANLNEGTFLELEKRKASFKHVFNTAQTAANKDPDQESFETSHQIYANDLIANEVPSHYGSTPSESIHRIWEQTGTTEATLWSTGDFSSNVSASGYTDVERLTIPLMGITNTSDQTYISYLKTGLSNSSTAAGNILSDSISRLKNWINPVRYGSYYGVKVYESNATYTGPDLDKEIVTYNSDVAGKNYGGYIFDYYQGMVYIAHDDAGPSPDMANVKFPLWIDGYRYIGATGSAASSGGLTSIDGTTQTNLSFDADTSVITIGAQTAAIGVGSLSPYKRAYYNNDFARHNFRNSSSILVNSVSDASGAPYTNGADNQLLIPVIHMPMGFGFSIGFTSSNFESADLSGENYFEHTKADKWDLHATETSSHYLEIEYTDGANGNIPFKVRAANQLLTEQPNTDIYRGWYKGTSTTRLEFDITSKTKFEIADGLRQLINNGVCYQHVSASVIPEGSDYRLQVEQVYAGYPYADYSILYTGSNTSTNLQEVSGHTFYGERLTSTESKAQNLWRPERVEAYYSDNVLYQFASQLSLKSSYLGALGLSTSAEVNFSNEMSPGFGNKEVQMFHGNNSAKAFVCLSDATQSGLPYGDDTILVNGRLGQLNPTNIMKN